MVSERRGRPEHVRAAGRLWPVRPLAGAVTLVAAVTAAVALSRLLAVSETA